MSHTDLELAGRLSVALALAVPYKNARRAAVAGHTDHMAIGDRCLDLGTGYGGVIHHCITGGSWTFLDSNAERLAIARTILDGEFVVGSMLSGLPGDGEFTLVTALDSVIYLDDIEGLAEEIRQRLAPGGRFLVTGWEPRRRDPLLALRRRLGIVDATGAVRTPGSAELSGILRRAGFGQVVCHHLLGPLTLLLQTALDSVLMRRGSGGDRLSYEFTEDAALLRRKLRMCRLLRLVTGPLLLLDRLLFFMPRYAYLLSASR